MAHAHITADEKSDSSIATRDKLSVNQPYLDPHYPCTPRVSLTHYHGSPRVSTSYHPNTSVPSLSDISSLNKNRRRSTIHSYNLVNYYALPQDTAATRNVKAISEAKVLKNVVVLGLSFMFVHTAFVSVLSLQSIMNPDGGVGVVSISCIYATTVVSCLMAPWIINTISTKWTMVAAYVLFTVYFAGNFYPKEYMLIPLGLILGMLGGPLMSAQATFVTTLSITYAQSSRIFDQDSVINKYMGIFCGFYRSSYIWGNLITTLVLSNNQTLLVEHTNTTSFLNHTAIKTCGAAYCHVNAITDDVEKYDIGNNPYDTEIPDGTKYMLLSIYLGCGIMGVVILLALLDVDIITNQVRRDFQITTKELCLSTVKMLKDSRCQLLVPLVLFVGLEQGFIFGDFTKIQKAIMANAQVETQFVRNKFGGQSLVVGGYRFMAYVNCTMGVYSLGAILMCFGGVSAVSSIVIGCIADHIKRFAFITAGATFNVGLLIVLWLWRPAPIDIPNFFVVAACLGLCDAIWQTQTYTLFGVLFVDKQEAAFASYRMFYATGCSISFGYSYFLCVETKVYILAALLILSLVMYSVIEMKVQLQSQHIKDIVAF